MRKILLIIACFAFSSQAFCQNLSAKQLFKKYKKQQQTTAFTVPGFVTKIGALFMDKDDAEMKYIIKKIKGLKIALIERDGIQNNLAIDQKLDINQLDSNIYEPLMTVEDGKEQVHFLINEQNEVIKELVIQVNDIDEKVFLLLNGKFKLNEIKKLVNSMEMDNLIDIKMDNLEIKM